MTDATLEAALHEMPDDDSLHPLSVLGVWTLMLAEDYGVELPPQLDLAYCAAYLDRTLHRLAQDDQQDFPLFAREIRRCRNHLEAVLRNSATAEQGAPCPRCTEDGEVIRLRRDYGHWCDSSACEQQFHYSTVVDSLTRELVPDTSGDWWVCPRDRAHRWSHEDYIRWVEERQAKVGA